MIIGSLTTNCNIFKYYRQFYTSYLFVSTQVTGITNNAITVVRGCSLTVSKYRILNGHGVSLFVRGIFMIISHIDRFSIVIVQDKYNLFIMVQTETIKCLAIVILSNKFLKNSCERQWILNWKAQARPHFILGVQYS